MDADVIVIGAGAAGLAAARMLAQTSKLRVLIIEARDRIGGRVYSVASSRRIVPAELGAEFIHGKAAQTMAMLRSAGTAAIETGGRSIVRESGGKLREDRTDFIEGAHLLDRARTLDEDMSVEQYLHRFADDPSKRDAAWAARIFVEGFEAADPSVASVMSIAEERHSGVDDFSARPLGGYPIIFDVLREECARGDVRVQLETPVQRIVWKRGSVEVEDGTQTFRARAAIVTVPIGVLRSGTLRFEPTLPESKEQAIEQIEMGDVVKVVLRFRTSFWESMQDGRFRDVAFVRNMHADFLTYWTQLPIHAEHVNAWAGGPRAAALRTLPREEIFQRALRGIGEAFGDVALAQSEFEEAFYHDWTADPYARGAYSYVRAGGGDARARLGTPLDGALFFAGEATATDGQGGTVNGGIDTGERAARELLSVLEAIA